MTSLRRPWLGLVFVAAGLLSPSAHAAKGHGAHEHGLARVNVAVQDKTLSVQIEVPLDSLLGFEHRPATAAEQHAAQAALQVFRQPASWLKPDAAASCRLVSVDIDDAALRPVGSGAAKPGAAGAHAELNVSYEYQCAAPQQLLGLDLELTSRFKRLQQLKVQVAGVSGQREQALKPPQTRVLLRR